LDHDPRRQPFLARDKSWPDPDGDPVRKSQ